MYRLFGLFSLLSSLIGFSKFLKFREFVEDNDGKIDDKAKYSFNFSIYTFILSLGLLISSMFMYVMERDESK